MKFEKSVLYIGGFELPDKNAAAQRVIANGKLLYKLSFNVFYLGLDRKKKTNNFFEDSLKFEDFLYWSKKYPQTFSEWANYLLRIKDIKTIISKNLEKKPDIIIAYNYPAFALLRLKFYCKVNNIKLIADCTEWYQSTGSIGFRIIKSLDTVLRMRWLHNRIDGVIAISRFLFEYYKSKNQIVTLLPPLVDKENPKWKSNDYKQNKIRQIIYAGSPGDGNKDKIDLIINALSEVKKRITEKFHLTIIGISKEIYDNNFGLNTIPNIINDNITFKGRLSHVETINAIKKADYFIFLREDNLVTRAGFPTKFVEAISCGTPVLTNGSSNIKDYLNEGENGYLLNLDNYKKLAKTLEYAISQSYENILSMKNSCKNANLFDYNNYTSDFSSFLNTVLVNNIEL